VGEVTGTGSMAIQHAPDSESVVLVLDGFARLVIPIEQVTMVDGRVLLDVTGAAMAAELDRAGVEVRHHHPHPTASQIANAVAALPAARVDMVMARLAGEVGMDVSAGQLALLAMADLLTPDDDGEE
jgi:hypothetical protein